MFNWPGFLPQVYFCSPDSTTNRKTKTGYCASTVQLSTLITAICRPISDAKNDYFTQTLITTLFDQSKWNDNDNFQANRYVLH